MHFKNIVALVVREYVAHQLHIPVTEVTMDNLNTFLQDNDIPTIVQCIFDAIFGSQGSIKAKNTVDYWLRYTDSMTKILFPDPVSAPLKNTPLRNSQTTVYPNYNIQGNYWVDLNFTDEFKPSDVTLNDIQALLKHWGSPLNPKTQQPQPQNENLPQFQHLMLKNIAIKGIQPPRLNAQTAVVPADQQQTMESRNISIESCNYNSSETTRVFSFTETVNKLPRLMDVGGVNDVAASEKKSKTAVVILTGEKYSKEEMSSKSPIVENDQCRKRSLIPVTSELSDDSYNAATTSIVHPNSSITLSDDCSLQWKRQRISSNAASSKHEDSTSNKRKADDDDVDNNLNPLSNSTLTSIQGSIRNEEKLGSWNLHHYSFIVEKIFLETKVEPNIFVWASAATISATETNSHNVLYRERLQKDYETLNIRNHSEFCRNQVLKNKRSYGSDNKVPLITAAPTGMLNLYEIIQEFELEYNCKFKFLPSSIGKCLRKFSKNADLFLDPMHLVSNNVKDVLKYRLRYGLIPVMYCSDLKMFLKSVFLNHGFDSESTRRYVSGRSRKVRLNLIEGEIEALLFDYWSRSTVDLINYNEGEPRQDVKGLLQYLFQKLCVLYKVGILKGDLGLFLTNFRKFAEFDSNNSIIPAKCLLFLKNNISIVWADLSTNDQSLWCSFFHEMKVQHYLLPHTISAMFKTLDRRFDFIISKAAQLRSFRGKTFPDVSLWYLHTASVPGECRNIVREKDVISILPNIFRSFTDVKNLLCTAIDNFYYYHIFLLSRYVILHNIDVASGILTFNAVCGFLDEQRDRSTPKNGQKFYEELHLSERMQHMMVLCFRRLYIRDSDKFEADFEITEFDPTLYQLLNELICARIHSALIPVTDHKTFSSESFSELYPRKVVSDGSPLSSDHLCRYAFASSLYAHMYGLAKRGSVSMQCAELNCNFDRDDKDYYDNIIAESNNFNENISPQTKNQKCIQLCNVTII